MPRTTHLERVRRREQVKRYIAAGINSPTRLSELLHVNKKTISNDIKHIQKEILEDVKTNTDEIISSLVNRTEERNKELWRMLMSAEGENIKLGAINSMRENDKQFLAALQSLGIISVQPQEVIIAESPLDKLKEAIKRERAKEDDE